MSKPTVVKLFIGSVAAAIAGVILAAAGAWYAFANDVFVMHGHDVVGVEPSAAGWALFGLFALSALAMIGGFIGGLVAWIGALLNTADLEDKTWFILLLVLGLFSFGLVAMIAYVIAGPDGTQGRASRSAGTSA